MANFSKTSKQKLSTCHPDLQRLFDEVVKLYDCTIVCGSRSEEDQEKAFLGGFSKIRYPNSKHNAEISRAVDVVPYFNNQPHIRWSDRLSFVKFAYFVQKTALKLGIEVIWGADWNDNGLIDDERFIDMPHWQLK